MEKKFNIGDYVRMKHFPFEGKIRRITGIEGNAYWVDGLILCTEAHFEPISAKDAFLSELKDLLAKYGANIYDYEQYKLCIDLGSGEQLEWYWGDKPMNKSCLSADNVFDYDND